ncbi:hypothetical protein AJ79_01492 [Helicocarpus griseus UAMH5409]|uniref:WD-like domain-containing protein n=1 Tax=Helicocarpus griseus UAMH5409 TaxID=1447875 RepID=A0A2B7Y7E9_9EURO|nr:hypothetical protein AJ79_01492 [Helicocarpus griseus UAMH5409]
MQFKSITLVLACVLATGLMASPLQARNEFAELYRVNDKDGGSLIYYGFFEDNDTETPTSDTSRLQERASCPTMKEPKCDGANAARNPICDKLVTDLEGNSDVNVPGSPRQICYQGSTEKNAFCCVSWHNKVPNLNKGELAPFAHKILRTCTANGISGKIYGVRVGGTCTDACLSNRGTHC